MTFMVTLRMRSVPPTALYTSKATALCSDSSSACHTKRFFTSSWPNDARVSSLVSSSSANVAVKCSSAAVVARFDFADSSRQRKASPFSVKRSTCLVG